VQTSEPLLHHSHLEHSPTRSCQLAPSVKETPSRIISTLAFGDDSSICVAADAILEDFMTKFRSWIRGKDLGDRQCNWRLRFMQQLSPCLARGASDIACQNATFGCKNATNCLWDTAKKRFWREQLVDTRWATLQGGAVKRKRPVPVLSSRRVALIQTDRFRLNVR
jgi:hypothetical protein